MSAEKMDISKVLAVLAQPKEAPAPLEKVERLRLEISYITKDEKIDTRTVRVVMPQETLQPIPLIYVPHYEMGEDALELRDYLAKGWAVACPSEFTDNYNGKLTDDDLVFNNAALYTLRHRPEFDTNRIILVGGSAGGYMTMMLNGLQLGLCASIANGPITNTYFNFQYYFPKANGLNLKALAKIAAENAGREEKSKINARSTDDANEVKTGEDVQEEQPDKNQAALALLQSLQSLPIPFLAGLVGMFAPISDNFPDKENYQRWEILSGVGVADCFSSPVMVNHCTSDVLVPVDQISKKYTYAKAGDSLPEEYNARLPESFPGKLSLSLEEALPKADTRTECFEVPEKAEDCNLPYDSSKRFNINIFDDGPAEGYGTHSSRMDVGRRFDVPYLEEMFERTAAVNCILTPAMLRSLLLRYLGESIALPAHVGVDEAIYGSLAVYQKEVREELTDWEKKHGSAALMDVMNQVLENEMDSDVKEKLKSAMEEIMKS